MRKPLRNRGPFPNDEAAFKLFFLAIRNAKTRWHADKSWYRVLAQLDIFSKVACPHESSYTKILTRSLLYGRRSEKLTPEERKQLVLAYRGTEAETTADVVRRWRAS